MSRRADPFTLDVNRFIHYCVSVEFPRLNVDGEWVVEEVEELEPDVFDLRKRSEELSRAVTKKAAEFQVVYLGIGDLPEETHPWLEALKAHGVDALLAVLNALAILHMPPLHAAILACTINIATVFKNVLRLAGYVFDFFDYLDEEINDAIDRLQHQLEQKAIALIQPPIFGLAVALTVCISFDVAQCYVHVCNIMPWVLQRSRNFVAAVATPFVIFCLLQMGLELWLDGYGFAMSHSSPMASQTAGSLSNGTEFINVTSDRADFISAASVGGAGDLKVEGVDNDHDQYKAVITQLLWSLIVTLVRSWPFIRFTTNNLISFAEFLVNSYLRRVISVEALQEVCWKYAQAMGDLQRSCDQGVRRACTR